MRFVNVVIALVLVASLGLRAATARRVTIRTDDGVTLAGTYFEASRRPAPAILLLPMLTRNHDDWAAAGARLADAGYAVLAIDFRNGGDADEASLELDVKAAKAFLRERPEVIPNALGLAGASIGANVALDDAADDPAVQSIALLSPGLDYRGLRTEPGMKKFGGRVRRSWCPARRIRTHGARSRHWRPSGREPAKCGSAMRWRMAPCCFSGIRTSSRRWWTGLEKPYYDQA